jgi:hypothetical protein
MALCADESSSENPQEQETGHWIIYDVHGHKACKCSECGKDAGYPCNDKYCRHCGARIVESQESEEISDTNLKNVARNFQSGK